MDSLSLWTQLELRRRPFLNRAQDASAVTLPYLIPADGFSQGEDLIDTFSSIGARGVNNLASKLLLALFPIDAPFFQFDPEPDAFGDLEVEQQNQLTVALREREATITKDIEVRGTRVALYEALRQLIVGGNCVLHLPDEGAPKVYSLPQFVVERDGAGVLQNLLIGQEMHPDDVPSGVQTLPATGTKAPENVKVITLIKRLPSGDYRISQEVNGTEIASGSREVSEDRLPYKVLRLNRISGEDYGRGFVEEHLGDLQTIEGLTQAAMEATAAMAQVRYLVDPAGTTNPEDLNNAPNGSFVPGKEQDISVLQTQKAMDMRVVQEMLSSLSRQLQQSFLLTTGIQRDGERVTATEISSLVRELEGALGGIYSGLTAELQLPLVLFTSARMIEEEKITKLEEDVLRPRIVTGVEALGRSQELNRLQTAAGLLNSIFGPDTAKSILKLSSSATKIFAAAGLSADDYVKGAEELQADQQAAQASELALAVAPNATNQLGEGIRAQQEQEQ